jgi:hypothetical protein
METLLNYKFDKPFYSQSQLLSIFGSISESTLKKYMKDWVEEGKELVDMGYFRIDGVRENQWEPQTFCRWLLANKIKVQANKIESNLIDINNKRRKNVSN